MGSLSNNRKDDAKLTLEQVRTAAPRTRRKSISQENVDEINAALKNNTARKEFRENILNYISVLGDGRYKIYDYISAVKYCSFKLLGDSNIAAYVKTFPDRYQHFVDNGTEDRQIAGHVSLYNKGLLVNKIMEQTIVPHHILNMDMYQQALNTQTELMMHAKSEKVRSDAANSILTHLKAPEIAKIELDVNIKQDDAIMELRNTTLELVKQQKLAIEAGASSVKQIAHSKILRDVIDVEVVE